MLKSLLIPWIFVLVVPKLHSQEGEVSGVAIGEEQDKVVEVLEASQIESFLAPFVYVRSLHRDPFETQGKISPLKPGKDYGPFLAVQTYRLNQYKLKGLLWNTSEPVALFSTPEGYEFRVKIKDYLGENFGYVAAIREKEVVVIQTIEENGKRYSTTKVLFLNE